jgi:hypothetical protein
VKEAALLKAASGLKAAARLNAGSYRIQRSTPGLARALSRYGSGALGRVNVS